MRSDGGSKKEPWSQSLEEAFPHLAAEWHTERNDRPAAGVTPGSTYLAWWQCAEGHEWQKRVSDRTAPSKQEGNRNVCPDCRGTRGAIRHLLVMGFPHLAAEYMTRNELPLSKVTSGRKAEAWWECGQGHIWLESVAKRTRNERRRHGSSRCPECHPRRPVPHLHKMGTSKIEGRVAALLRVVWPDLDSNATIDTASGEKCSVDMLVPAVRLVVEYDGEYFHRGEKQLEADKRKTRSLEKSGYTVIRVRDRGLPKAGRNDVRSQRKEPAAGIASLVVMKAARLGLLGRADADEFLRSQVRRGLNGKHLRAWERHLAQTAPEPTGLRGLFGSRIQKTRGGGKTRRSGHRRGRLKY